MEKFLGIDMGGTNVKFGIVTENGELLEKVKHPTSWFKEQPNFLEAFGDKLRDFLVANPEIKKVGMGLPGMLSLDRRSTVEFANVPELNGLDIMDFLESKFPGITFYMDNDANVAALGEYYFGENEIPASYLFVTLGTGVGGGLVIDKKIWKGVNGNGLEIGHIIAGNGDTIEENVGKKGLVALAHKYLERDLDRASLLHEYPGFDAKRVAKCALKGDKVAKKVYVKAGKYVGEMIVSCARILDVKTVIVGGGVAETFPLMEAKMYDKIKEHLSEYYTDSLDIRLATLANEAGIIGAASLCF